MFIYMCVLILDMSLKKWDQIVCGISFVFIHEKSSIVWIYLILCIHLSIDVQVISIFWLLWMMLL